MLIQKILVSGILLPEMLLLPEVLLLKVLVFTIEDTDTKSSCIGGTFARNTGIGDLGTAGIRSAGGISILKNLGIYLQ